MPLTDEAPFNFLPCDPEEAKPFLDGHCHHLALAIRERVGGTLMGLLDVSDWPDEEAPEHTVESLVAEGRFHHVFVRLDDGLVVDVAGACRDAGALAIREYWPGGETGTMWIEIEPEHVDLLVSEAGWRREAHPATEAMADRVVDDLAAAGLLERKAEAPAMKP